MKRHRISLRPDYTSSGTDHGLPRHGIVPPASSTGNSQLIYSQLYSQPHGNLQHQPPLGMLPRTSDPVYRFDSRSASIFAGSVHQSHIPGAMHLHPSSSVSFPSRRVSLLRDIGIAGEREKELPISAPTSQMIEAARHIPTPVSQISSNIHGPERPITIMGNLHQSFQRQQLQIPANLLGEQSSTPPRHILQHNTAGSRPMADMKKETTVMIKQENGSKVLSTQPSNVASLIGLGSNQLLQRQSSAGPSASSTIDATGAHNGGSGQKSKEDLVQAMDKVDREITKVESEINRLQKKKTQLEESAKKPPEPEKAESSPQRVEPKHRDLWQIIYAENKKKAEAARSVLDGICPIYDMPLYNQPSDTKVYQDNLKKNEEMRPKLLNYFRHRKKLQNIREKYLGARYDQLMDKWQRKTEALESNAKRKAKEAKTREFFEKIFPEVRKQREQQERMDRVGTRGDTCRSDADFAEIVDGLSEQENHLQHMRQQAIVPPMLLDKEERRVTFISNNGYIREPFKEFKESQQLDAWAVQEKAIFKEKYVQHPKNFHLIASFIEKKNVADCILYYYLTKKANNYKALVRKQTLKPRKPKSGRAHASSHHHEQSGSSHKDVTEKADKDDSKKDLSNNSEDSKVDRPPSPRMTRARKQTLNWTEEEINIVKEGFGKHGRDFSLISRMVSNKSEQQVKNFYNHYKNKKKHGLDQLINEGSKKKKTRSTRHAAPSPDISTATADEDASLEPRKLSESSTSEEKHQTNKEKPDDNFIVDEKKIKSKDQDPSPAFSNSKSGIDAGDVLTTSYIRTRRTTAALAAAGQDQHAEFGKRSSDNKSPGSVGEPAEKRHKTERKAKTTELNAKEIVKTEVMTEEVAATSQWSNNDQTTKELDGAKIKQEFKDASVSEISDAAKSENNKVISEEEITKPLLPTQVAEKKDLSKPETSIADNKLVKEQNISEDHDSSATCSADEEPQPLHASQIVGRAKHDSPYAFEFNDSPTRIQLDHHTTRHTPTTAHSITVSTVLTCARNDGALNLAKKPVNSEEMKTIPSKDERPHSLPPRSMVPSVSTSVKMIPASAISGVDDSRPSSTPVYGDFPLPHTTKGTTLFQQQFQTTHQGLKVLSNFTKSSSLYSGQPHIVTNIGNLKYTGPATKPMALSMSSNPNPNSKSMSTVVDLTKGSSASAAPVTTVPLPVASSESKHHYHPVHPSAASLQKDFNPSLSVTSSAVPGELTSGYQHSYSAKDKQAMRERAADIPESPIPVSALLFKSTKAPTLLQPGAAAQNVILKNSDTYRRKEKIKPSLHPMLIGEPTSLDKQYFSAAMSNMACLGSLAGGIPLRQKTVCTSSLSMPIDSLVPSISSPERRSQETIAGIRLANVDRMKTTSQSAVPLIIDPRDIGQSSVYFSNPARRTPLQGPTHADITGICSKQSMSNPVSPTRKDSISRETLLNPLPTLHPAPMFPGYTFSHMLPAGTNLGNIKQEKNTDFQLNIKQSHLDDARRTAISVKVDPAHGFAHQYFPPASHSMVSRDRAIDEGNSLMQRSTLSPQPMPKSSHRSSSALSQNVSRHSSPIAHSHIEKQFKEEIPRPSSAARRTPDRRSVGDSSVSTSHHRSFPSQSITPMSRSRPVLLPDVKPKEEPPVTPITSITHHQIICATATAAVAANPKRHPTTSFNHALAIPTGSDQENNPNVIPFSVNPCYYQIPGAPPGLASMPRPTPPNSRAVSTASENPENSRQKLLSQDFATAQLMQQQQQLAGHFPFQLPGFPAMPPHSNPPNPLVNLRQLELSNQADRISFIPGQTSVASPLSSPHTSLGLIKTSRPQSPPSPHRANTPVKQNVRSLYPSPSPVQIVEAMAQAAGEKFRSSSPLRGPNMDRRSPTYPAHEARKTPPVFHPLPLKESLGRNMALPEGFLGALDPHAATRSATSPNRLSHKSRTIKQEKSSDLIGYDHAVVSESMRGREQSSGTSLSCNRDYHVPLTMVSSESSRTDSEMALQVLSGLSNDASKRTYRSFHEDKSKTDKSNIKREPDKWRQSHVPTGKTQEKIARDLKYTGRTVMTTGLLINAIIDRNINQYEETAKQEDKKEKYKTQEMAIKPPIGKPAHSESGTKRLSDQGPSTQQGLRADPTIISIARQAAVAESLNTISGQNTIPAQRTKTLHECSHDIISGIYNQRSDSTKLPGRANADTQKQEEVAMAQNPMVAVPGVHSSMVMESRIREALQASQGHASGHSSPLHEAVRQTRSDSNTPVAHSSLPPAHSEQSLHHGFQSKHEMKKVDNMQSDNYKHVAPAASQQMFSVLSFRGVQGGASAQQIPPTANISGRPHMVPGGPRTYHPQQSAVREQAPHYEPLSDDSD
ncbi:uncharacterized protein LOC143445222 isoform X4 [Clavelina lepadiformis]|uniref:uncharacterized protein LOC143445222 isoform X4 n=1 Tax=Clavelina lepadiformis TaxID=159417 RepID=UPI004042C09A